MNKKKVKEKTENNKEPDEESENSKKQKKDNQTKQLVVIVVIMLVVLGVILGAFYIKNKDNKFDYIGLHWQKTQLGKLFFYSTRIPVANKNGEITGNYAINLRNNPKKLDYIKTDIPGGLMKFILHKTVYLTLDPQMKPCDMNVIAVSEISGFLNGFGGLDVKTAVTNKSYAKENKLKYVTCDNHPANTVIVFKSGNETKITKFEDCYTLTYSNCDSVKLSEKFILLILEGYMKQEQFKNW